MGAILNETLKERNYRRVQEKSREASATLANIMAITNLYLYRVVTEARDHTPMGLRPRWKTKPVHCCQWLKPEKGEDMINSDGLKTGSNWGEWRLD